jgi:hypothetical protein
MKIMIKVKIALVLLFGVLINSSCSKTSIEDICSNMNTYEGSYNWESYIKSSGWKFKSLGKTEDGITIKSENTTTFEESNFIISRNNFEGGTLENYDSVYNKTTFGLQYLCCSFDLFSFENNKDNQFTINKYFGGQLCEIMCNKYTEINKFIISSIYKSICLKVDENLLHLYFEGDSKYNIITFEKL